MFYIGQIQEKGTGCTLKKSLLSCTMILLTCTFAFWNIWFPRRPKCQMYYSKKEIGKTRSSCGWTFGVGGKLAGAFTFWNTNIFVGKKRSSNCGCTFGVGGKSGVVAANKSWNVIRSIITPTGKQIFFSWKVQILLFKN